MPEFLSDHSCTKLPAKMQHRFVTLSMLVTYVKTISPPHFLALSYKNKGAI